MRTSEAEGVPRGHELDWRSVEWPRAQHAVYGVRQRYSYEYTAPVSTLRQRLIMVPREVHGDQRLLEHQLTVNGAQAPVLSWHEDAFGNRTCTMRAPKVEEQLVFEASYRVARIAGGTARPGLELARTWAAGTFLESTALTAPDASLEAAAAELAREATSQLTLAERANTWAAGAIAYQIGVTGVQTPAAMALHLGKGVCQDYAHMMLAVLRLLGIPARYVSGHLLGEGAPHAWVEALVADANDLGLPEVIAFDPTHHRRAGLNYITVAVGRDYADVAPTSGTFVGPASGRLSASKQAEIVRLEYDDGTTWADSKATAQDAESAA
ncbi:MAG TPA: transglutaminase family protein [Chloroflexota bacterium]|nr:transglutaminase family protein [Chloroflexota bacterium]